jgi:copper chaperone CopZ
MKVEPILKSTKGVENYTIDLEHPDKIVSISAQNLDVNLLIANFKKAGYSAEKL